MAQITDIQIRLRELLLSRQGKVDVNGKISRGLVECYIGSMVDNSMKLQNKPEAVILKSNNDYSKIFVIIKDFIYFFHSFYSNVGYGFN